MRLTYHFINGNAWRKENPLLDSEIEFIVTQLQRGKLRIDEFDQFMEQKIHKAFLDYADGTLSREAATNYEYVFYKIKEAYWRGERHV